MSKHPRRVYQFKVSLLGIEPEIWRVMDVPESYTFWDLHVAIQDVMGWLDYHLHAFVPEVLRDLGSVQIGVPEGPTDDEYVAGWTVPIVRHFFNSGDTARYDYDFGDGWSHKVELVAIMLRERAVKYPLCIAGERACPPEDCGGVSGYYRLLKVLAGPHDEEYGEFVEWLQGHAKNYFPYNPDAFDVAAVKFRNSKKRWKMMMGYDTSVQ